MELIVGLVGCIGLVLLAFGGFNMLGIQDNKGRFKNLSIATIGGIFLLSSVTYMSFLNDKNENELKNNVAIMLETTPDKIIVQDISESSLFGLTKNNNLRKVFVEGREYMIEVLEDNAVKISESHQE